MLCQTLQKPCWLQLIGVLVYCSADAICKQSTGLLLCRCHLEVIGSVGYLPTYCAGPASFDTVLNWILANTNICLWLWHRKLDTYPLSATTNVDVKEMKQSADYSLPTNKILLCKLPVTWGTAWCVFNSRIKAVLLCTIWWHNVSH